MADTVGIVGPEVDGSSARLVRPTVDRAPLRVAPATVTPIRELRRPRSPYVNVVKPACDRVAAAIGLVVATVPMALISLSIVVTMGRPVLFRQQRIGRDGEPFEVLKFRTMHACRRARTLDVIHDRRVDHKSAADPRHTRIGRKLRQYGLDELPQLVNVLRGEMSIVGPRPELAEVIARYPLGLEQRHLVKPGLTGLWQVSARGDGPMHENGRFDLDYVERISWRTDLRIIAETPRAMLIDRRGE
jgi:lipopolysaccharide/colanic/teichoic acid biosynthesis glycosyltransferase